MRWDSISKIHQLAFIRRLSIWLLILPALAKLAAFLASLRPEWAFVLPFTWGFLYCAAVLFLLSTALYAIRCPKIVKDYEGWFDYRDRESSYEKLIPLVNEVAKALPDDRRFEFLKRQFELAHIRPVDKAGGDIPSTRWQQLSNEPQELEAALRRSTTSKTNIADVYAAAREAAQELRKCARLAILALHVTAAACVLALFAENSMFVVEHYYPDSAAVKWWRAVRGLQ